MARLRAFVPGSALGVILVAVACGADPGGDGDDTTGTTNGPTTTVTTTDPSASSTASTTATSATTSASTTMATSASSTMTDTSVDDSSSTGEPPAEPAIHWVGRTDTADPSRTRLGWSGAGFVVRFDGTGVTARMDDAGRYFTVVVDGVVQANLATSPGEQDYAIATGLPPGEHTVEVYRRTEGSFGVTSVVSVTVEGELLAPPPVSRRIEIIGDSITCGYGNEGASPCSFSAETENHYMTYGAIAARGVGAELSTVAWSGKGIIYNYGEDTNEPLPVVYDRILASDVVPWDFSWQPDVVAVNLGTNDFSTDGDPTQELFVGEYVEFATHLRDVYPDAYILLLAPSLYGDELTMVEGYLQQVVDTRTGAGDTQIDWANINVEWIGSGCDGHPTVATHEGMGGRLVEELALHVGW